MKYYAIFSFSLFLLVGCSRFEYHKSSTPKKLDTYFDHFEKVQIKLLTFSSSSNKRINLEGLEKLINNPSTKIEEKDIKNLQKFHKQLVNSFKNESLKKSLISLNKIRKKSDDIEKFCRELPKGGLLHVHPGGTLSLSVIKKLLTKINPKIESMRILKKANDGIRTMLYLDEVRFINGLNEKRYLELSEKEKRKLLKLFSLDFDKKPFPFKRFQSIFSLKNILYVNKKTKKMVKQKMHLDFIERAKENNVIYVEYTKVMDVENGILEKITKISDRLYKKSGIYIRWNWAFVRGLDPEKNKKSTLDLINLLKRTKVKHSLVGIDLLANEKNMSAFEAGQGIYLPILNQVNKGNISLSRTIHAGEHGLAQNVRDGILIGANRIGHGVIVQNDPLTLEYMRRNQLGIDINLSSNLYLGVAKDVESHPFLTYLRMGIPVSLSTDDEGMFNTNISKECVMAVKKTDIDYGELKAMSFNSIKNSFASKNLKKTLSAKLREQFQLFEDKWVIPNSK